VLDCIEFDDRLRRGDVLLDAAFLAMDLERLGAPELGRRFLRWYDEFWGHSWPQSLAHHYVAYRAHVRAKVACLRHVQGDPEAAAEAGRLHDLCLAHLEEARVRLVLVGGPPGTGKSTLGAALSADLEWDLLRSDEVRKDLAGLSHETRASAPYGQGLYRPERVEATYRMLLDRARTALGRGESVILDASWADGRQRDAAAEAARKTHSELVELRCEAPMELAARRIAARNEEGSDASDAQPALAALMAAEFKPWATAAAIDTTVPVATSLQQALAAIGDAARAAPRP
jgi:predicted kinase